MENIQKKVKEQATWTHTNELVMRALKNIKNILNKLFT